jgi:hypothetical protein
MRKTYALFILGLASILPHHALAFGFTSINPAGAFLEGAANFSGGFGQHAGIKLPDGSSTSSFALGFVVPEDYVPGQQIRVGLAWHTDAITPCTLTLKPNFLSVARFGQPHILGTSVTSGLVAADGDLTLSAAASNVTALKVYKITSPDGATSLQPFDVINFGLYRSPTDPYDNCAGNLTIQGIGLLFGD